MKYTLIAFALLLSLSSFGQQIDYKQWQEDAKNEINLRPEYGNVKKSPAETEEDQKFIETVLKQDETRKIGSEHLVKLGFDYLYKGDLKTAMRRFNQAWLLDPKNENAYWGYATIYFNFNDRDEAKRQLDKGLLLNPNSSNILTDEATIYMSYYVDSKNKGDLYKAIELFKQSYKVDPKNQNTLFKLSAAYFYTKDCINALKYYNECMALGGASISPGYGDALKKMCN